VSGIVLVSAAALIARLIERTSAPKIVFATE
jgi:hypothetical protein